MELWEFPSKAELAAMIFPDDKPGSVFAVLDSAVWENLPSTLSDYGAMYCLLTRQPVSHGLMHTLPYLVELRKDEPFAQVVINQIGHKKEVFLRTEGKMLYDVFEDLVMLPHVRLPGDVEGWFRFYDPSVLRTFLSFATKQQVSALFGQSVSEYLYEDEFSASICSHSRPDSLEFQKGIRIQFTQDQIELLDKGQHEYLRLKIMKETWREMTAQNARSVLHDPRPAFGALLDIAEDSGIRKMQALQDFALLAVSYGVNFTAYQEVRDYLAIPERSEIKKVRGLEAILANLAKASNRGAIA